jgi:hypothetical protein
MEANRIDRVAFLTGSNIMRFTRTIATTVLGAGLLCATGATAAHATQTISMGARSCTVNAGAPFITTVNGARTLRSINTVTCNGVAGIGRWNGVIYNGAGTAVAQRTAAGTSYLSQASLVVDRRCGSAVNNYYLGAVTVSLDLNNDGVMDWTGTDYSAWNLRSCG